MCLLCAMSTGAAPQLRLHHRHRSCLRLLHRRPHHLCRHHRCSTTSPRVESVVYHPPVIHRDARHTHPMVTRQAVGVLRPRALSATEGEPRLSPIPTSIREALADPNWRRAMADGRGVSAMYHPPVIHRDPHHTHPMVTRQVVEVLRSGSLRHRGGAAAFSDPDVGS
jgi:hypothetical protein